MLLKPWKKGGNTPQRPLGPFLRNPESRQNFGLVLWYACQGSSFRAMQPNPTGNRIAPPTALQGSLQNAPFFPTEQGFVGRAEQTGSNSVGFFTSMNVLAGLASFTIAYWTFPILLSGSMAWWGMGTTNSTFCETTASGPTTGPFVRGIKDFRNLFTEVATIGSWQHLVWGIDSSTGDYYKNGVLQQSVASVSGTVTDPGAGIYIGAEPAGTGGQILGVEAMFSDFRIYNYKLNAQEIALLYTPASRWDLYWQPSTRIFYTTAGTARRSFLPILGAG